MPEPLPDEQTVRVLGNNIGSRHAWERPINGAIHLRLHSVLEPVRLWVVQDHAASFVDSRSDKRLLAAGRGAEVQSSVLWNIEQHSSCLDDPAKQGAALVGFVDLPTAKGRDRVCNDSRVANVEAVCLYLVGLLRPLEYAAIGSDLVVDSAAVEHHERVGSRAERQGDRDVHPMNVDIESPDVCLALWWKQ